jgi:competence protein ComEC
MAFSRVTGAGLLLNFAAIPLMTVVQAAGMAVLAAAVIAPAAMPAFALATHLAAWGLVESGRLVDLMPWAVARLPAPEIGVVATYYAGWLAALALSHVTSAPAVPSSATRRVRNAALGVAACAGAWILVAPQTRFARTSLLEVTFLDVGQGAATLVRFPSGYAMLIDAGGTGSGRFDIGRRVVEPVIWAAGVHRLTHFVATHGDADHIGGAASVVHDLEPGEIWEGVPVPPEPLARQLREIESRAGGAWRFVQRGDALAFGDVVVAIRHPTVPDWERQRVRNDDSVVVDLRVGVVSVMVTGDIEAAAEADLARFIEPAGIRVLLAPHHGSATSSTWPLLRVAAPDLAIISAGRGNRYGHPHRAVLERYRASGARILRTDRDGAITLRTDGRIVTVTTFSGRTMTLRPDSRRSRVPPA